MAEARQDVRGNETSQRKQTAETRGRSDVERSPATQHEVESRGRGLERGGFRRPSGLDFYRDPFSMMNAFRREMDQLFDELGVGGSLLRAPRLLPDIDRTFGEFGREPWAPQVEVFERENKLHVSADLPGLGKDDVKVEVLDNVLTIEGERRSEQRDELGRWSERSYGNFYRSIPLPEGISPESANASFENGVLEITFDAPKREQRRGKQIPISAKK